VADQQKKGQAIIIAGYFGLAASVKGRERSTPLWMLMLRTVWLDIVFVPLFAAGVEVKPPNWKGIPTAPPPRADYAVPQRRMSFV
jgi:hypothetical protein